MSDHTASVLFLGCPFPGGLDRHLFDRLCSHLGDINLLGRFLHLFKFLLVPEIDPATILEQMEDAMVAVVIESPGVPGDECENVIDDPESGSARIPCPLCQDCSPEILLPG